MNEVNKRKEAFGIELATQDIGRDIGTQTGATTMEVRRPSVRPSV